MNLYERLVENIEFNLATATKCHDVAAKRSMIQRARGVWDFGLFLIRTGEFTLLPGEQYDRYDALDKTIFDADHALDGKV